MSDDKNQPLHGFSPEEATFFDTSMPNITRVFDYFSGGSSHFEADRLFSHELLQAFPNMQRWVRLGYAFLQESVRTLYQDGFVQFIDIGSNIPNEDNVHTLAPAANFIYVDINPVAVSYGNSLFADLDNVEYIHGDARQMDYILHHPATQRLLSMSDKVGIDLDFLTFYLAPYDIQTMAQKLYDWAPAGSKIFQTLYLRSVAENDPIYTEFRTITAKAGLPLTIYTLEETLAMMAPWKTAVLMPITEYLGLPADYLPPVSERRLGMDIRAAIFCK